MMKRVLFLCFLMSALVNAYSQEVSKQVLNVKEFTSSSEFKRDEVDYFRSQVIAKLQKTDRIIVVDLAKQSSIKQEEQRRMSELSMNDDRDVEDITLLKANYILGGRLNSIQTQQRNGTRLDGTAYIYYSTTFSYTLELINPATGGTVKSYSYSTIGTGDNPQKSRMDAIRSKNLDKFVSEAFPVKGRVLQIDKEKDSKAELVYINLGSAQGISKGDKFFVYAVIDIAGALTEKEIGMLQVTTLYENRSLCKVNKGGEDVFSYMSKNVEVTIKTKK